MVMNRRQRRSAIANGMRREPFQRGPRPSVLDGDGWLPEVKETFQNGWFSVLVRPLRCEWGEVLHLAIRNVPNTGISWPDKQWIKDQLVGRERVAIEVFPSADDVIDAANMYHLWVLPKGMALPFGLHIGTQARRVAA